MYTSSIKPPPFAKCSGRQPTALLLYPDFITASTFRQRKTRSFERVLCYIDGKSVDLGGPAHVVRELAPLDAGDGIIQLVGDRADLAVVDVGNVALIAQLADRRDDRRGTGAEYFL